VRRPRRLLALRDRNKTLAALAWAEPVTGACHRSVQRAAVLSLGIPADPAQIKARRLELLAADPATAPHEGGVLVIDDNGDGEDPPRPRTWGGYRSPPVKKRPSS
jgi:hypothetical protein